MKKYYIIRPDGSTLFEQAYPEDFCVHCLIMLLDRTPNDRYYLCEIGSTIFKPCLVQKNSYRLAVSSAPARSHCW